MLLHPRLIDRITIEEKSIEENQLRDSGINNGFPHLQSLLLKPSVPFPIGLTCIEPTSQVTGGKGKCNGTNEQYHARCPTTV